MTALQFINFVVTSELPVAESVSDFKPHAIPPLSEIVTEVLKHQAKPEVQDVKPIADRLTEIIQWAEESMKS